MINFGELELRVNEKYSFVGIEKKGSRLIFHIPKGFSDADISSLNSFDSKRDLFFRFYRMLNIFKQTCLEKKHFETGIANKADDRDGVLQDNTGLEISSDENSQNIFYSKIDALGSILDIYDELKILAFINRIGKSDRLDYSKLHRFLNKAIFLDNGAIYIETMDLPRKQIHFHTTHIVSMYCYILTEIKQQLNQEISPQIKALAENFRENYLGSEYNLFSEKYYLQIINSLKDTLEVIDNYTPLKDKDYWDFYDAIKVFLFGELDTSYEGNIWGVGNFNAVWEAICLTHLAKTVDPAFILYLDNQFIPITILNKLNNRNPIIDIARIFTINAKNLSPDAVIISLQDEQSNSILFVDSNAQKSSVKYIMHSLNSKDYAYDNTFVCFEESSNSQKRIMRIIRIVDANEPNSNPDYKEFKKINNGYIFNSSSFPENYISYWDIHDLNAEELRWMCNLNHVFIEALKMNIFHNFYYSFIQKLTAGKENIFYRSLFGHQNRPPNFRKINQLFRKFLEKLHFHIIDIKYFNFDYYTNPDNMEEIKSRSVRKQFVYEYLLQKHLEKTNHPLKELDIKSEFWLPASSSNEETFTPLPKYMDDYIKLTGVNIMTVIDSYLETEER